MAGRHRKPRDKGNENLADRYRDGEFDNDRLHETEDATGQRFSDRNKRAQQDKMVRTALMRAEEQTDLADLESLPVGQVTQVYSLFCEVEHANRCYLCVVRKTLTKLADTQLVVGDRVRFRDTGVVDESGRSEAVIEQVQPRATVLTRADSFKGNKQHPIVANAEQMLIVASVKLPGLKWGLIDRMLVAARSGGLEPIICLNKLDLLETLPVQGGSERSGTLRSAGPHSPDTASPPETEPDDDETIPPLQALHHYTTLGVRTLQTSVEQQTGLTDLRDAIHDRTTVLAGHSGVGKSSLIRAIQPKLDIRIGEISGYTAKGRHTTTSARRYLLDFGGTVIDTPGVKLFGLWGVSQENLLEYFPDVEAGSAPQWRVKSYERIARSLV